LQPRLKNEASERFDPNSSLGIPETQKKIRSSGGVCQFKLTLDFRADFYKAKKLNNVPHLYRGG
jgi:hypothetical protein